MIEDLILEDEDVITSEGGSARRALNPGIWVEVEGGKMASTIFQSGDLAISGMVRVVGEDGTPRQDAVLFNTINLPKTNPGVADHTLSDDEKENRGKRCYQFFSAIDPDGVPKKMQWSKTGKHFFNPTTGDAVYTPEAKFMNRTIQRNAVAAALQTFNTLKNESSEEKQDGFKHNPDAVVNGDYCEVGGFTGERYFTKLWASKKTGKVYLGTLVREMPAGEVACYTEDELFAS
jgi:hypothetical protein